ncbi:AbrB/MazE/SpoVT family DNA-binding domain-containing protein [Fusobacterium necrophorum]|uniref:SpoVT-AbrB domain-containing protein n=1 Tax=Fusobacterium necrophorum DJ-2 TaxID=1441737 RepID=A0AB73C1A2_9FUSO|nr:AbrB/MazE/SpoVT family DNA-binding domain-containing protein [Fusobacterium necrophorum]KDE61732.1 hypothetical protein FUSO4_11280 [Fusobacterium necrophorum DJ-1]KDE66362.1 hypothetical protein FUSO5_02665 [Fusobacterium necrophorum BFTR-1]KDE69674.1 hypothetical protein FUSO6_06020 [Fusobacterium necrophorum DAB]KDE70289.1 hypothetical protein FUSO8_09370 [Fusobacterium necrophorum DJ-2]MBR8735003.1 hypothetical protein [Fusobacterium necrophorum]
MILTATITKWGNSQGLRLPKTLLEMLQWKNDDIVEIVVENNQLSIKKIEKKKRKSIQELFSEYEGEYQKLDMNWDNSMGKEFSW